MAVESRPTVEARPEVERPVADAKPIIVATPVVEAPPVAEVRPVVEGRSVVDGRVVVDEEVIVAQPRDAIRDSAPSLVVDGDKPQSLPSVAPMVAKTKMKVRREEFDASQVTRHVSKPRVHRSEVNVPPPLSAVIETKVAKEPVALHAAPPPASVVQAAPVSVAQSESVAQANAATARTEVIAEAVDRIVETVVDRIYATPSLAQGEGEIRIMLRPTVLDGSELSLSAKDGTLTVSVTPSTPEVVKVVAASLPTLETALAEHAPAFHHVAVVLATAKKGKKDEAA